MDYLFGSQCKKIKKENLDNILTMKTKYKFKFLICN